MSGVPFLKALELIALRQRSRRWNNLILDVRQSVREGATFTQALSLHKAFDGRYRAIIAWAESTGSSDNLLVALRLLADDTTSRFPRRLDKGSDWSQQIGL